MAKNSMLQIEEDERKILEELSTNANKSINEIAKTCKFSRQKVWRVIKNLEKNNTIWGYVAVIDEEKQGKRGYMILIKRTNKPLDDVLIDKIINRELQKKSDKRKVEILNSIYTNGIFDWVICFNAHDMREAKRFVEEVNKLFFGYISEIYLIEKMFNIESCGIDNPEKEKLRDFFSL